ncbi:MAG: hypothetical protein NVSMB42_02500 [Herpetosiphon sp.]
MTKNNKLLLGIGGAAVVVLLLVASITGSNGGRGTMMGDGMLGRGIGGMGTMMGGGMLGGGLGGMLLMVLFWALVIALLVTLVNVALNQRQPR